ncbi:TPA: Kae1-associated serine/threonine protein kinase [Candidatus Micrarchaeota archaeon]|nr:Kae1-associated serine/threonine protein kinase [Candidatus Micrarchaeota archaeon]
MRGAEAVVSNSRLLGLPVVIKERIPKTYRHKTLDSKLRTERTKREARLLNKAKLVGVPCPTVLEVTEFKIVMTKIRGKRADLIKNKNSAKTAGKYLAQLHTSNIIHGDYTPANLITESTKSGKPSKLFVIDFGLGFFSEDVEDKAIDVLTMLKSIPESVHKSFISGYSKYKNAKSVLVRVEEVKKRVRYA